jgi:hypothetical protein
VKRRARISRRLATALLLLPGCQALLPPDHPDPALWTIHGRIYLGSEEIETSRLRAAAVWIEDLDPRGYGSVANVAQDVEVDPSQAGRFSIAFDRLPPPEVLLPAETLDPSLAGRDLRVAIGALLFYDDRNKNLRLDLLPPGTVEPVDTILGPLESYSLYEFEGDLSGIAAVRPGLNIYHWTGPGRGQWLAPDVELFVTLYPLESLQYQMCRETPPMREGGAETIQVAPDQVPTDWVFDCAPDGRSLSYNYQRMEQPGGVCTEITLISVTAHSELAPGQAPPANWPCPVK